MNTNFVFTGFDKNGKERLIYIEIDKYIDLLTDENITNLDLETLKYLKKTIRVLKYMPKALIKKVYYKDRKKVIDTKNILIGTKGNPTNVKEVYNDMHSYIAKQYVWEWTPNETGLYVYDSNYKDYEYFKIYKNLYDGEKYIEYSGAISKIKNFYDGREYVDLKNKETVKDKFKEPVMTKKKVYELSNKIRKEK